MKLAIDVKEDVEARRQWTCCTSSHNSSGSSPTNVESKRWNVGYCKTDGCLRDVRESNSRVIFYQRAC